MLFLALKEKLAKSNFFKNVAKLMAGTVIAQALTVLASPILTRLYTPSDFGTFALFTAVVSVLSIVATGRYDLAVVVANNKKQAFNIITLAALLILGTGILTFITLSLFKGRLYDIFETDNVSALIILIPLSVVFVSAYQLLTYWANREKDYLIISKTKIVQNVVTIILTIGIGYLVKGLPGLILGFTGGALAAFYSILKDYAFSFKKLRIELSLNRLRQVSRHHRKFPLYSMPSSFLDTFSNQAPIFFITLFFGNTLAGHFGFTYRIISLPVALVGASIAQVFYQKLSEEYRNKGNCKKLIYNTWATLSLIGILPCLVLLLAGPQLFGFIFGSEWVESGIIAQYLAIMQLFILISSPTSTALIVFGAQNVSFAFGLASAIYRPLTLYIGHLTDDFYLGLILFVVCEIIQIILYNSAILKYSNKIQRVRAL